MPVTAVASVPRERYTSVRENGLSVCIANHVIISFPPVGNEADRIVPR
jgi:hypothetical protein